MDEIEKKARELLAVAYEQGGYPQHARKAREGGRQLPLAAVTAALSSAQAPEWISVGDRLPDLDVPVWLHDGEGSVFIGGRASVDNDEWGWCNCYSSIYQDKDGAWKANDMEFDDDYTVTHWLPLPTAPSAEGVGRG